MLRLSSRLSRCYNKNRKFTVLALESSADDTCAAVVTSDREILSNVVQKQHHLHKQWGGIHANVAVHAHQKYMPGVVTRALAEAKLDISQVDGIAFTRGPGMTAALAVTCNATKTLAAVLNKPIVGVHHMQAHTLIPSLTSFPDVPVFPFLTLLVSGGHTMIVLARSETYFKILATTTDDTIGRAYDKAARFLQLDYGDMGLGATLEAFCAQPHQGVLPANFLPFPNAAPGRLLFSYSGIHSHLDRYFSKLGDAGNLSKENKLAIARAFQEAVVLHLEKKLKLAFEWCEQNGIPCRHLVVSGGVASNAFINKRLHNLPQVASGDMSLIFPPPHLCTDNAVMIAWASMHRFLAGNHDSYETAPRPKWSLEDLDRIGEYQREEWANDPKLKDVYR